jgi:hypothetical protein
MKLNRWTLALAAAGIVTVPSLVRADDPQPNSLLTGIASTTLSGYVDTSAQWNFGTGNDNLPPYTPNGVPGGTKADGFNLNVVAITLNKPAAAEGWSAGYNATLLFGPDAVGYNPSFGTSSPGDFSLKDTYVDLRVPLGNGLDIKLGTYTEILGYEVFETGNNPNYTRSYGYAIEPTQMTGALATYQFSPVVTTMLGICNAWSAGINARSSPPKAESFKTYMGGVMLTAPDTLGALAGSTLMGGVINGYDAINAVTKTSWYVGGTLTTPIKGLKAGVAYDYVTFGQNTIGGASNHSGYQHAAGLYLLWTVTEKLTSNTRGDYLSQSDYLAIPGLPPSAFAVTETLQYELWKNVLSRLEFRWDHAEHGLAYSGTVAGTPTRADAYVLALNLIYKF